MENTTSTPIHNPRRSESKYVERDRFFRQAADYVEQQYGRGFQMLGSNHRQALVTAEILREIARLNDDDEHVVDLVRYAVDWLDENYGS